MDYFLAGDDKQLTNQPNVQAGVVWLALSSS